MATNQSSPLHKQLAGWNFDNTYSELPDFFYTKMNPAEVQNPQTIVINHRLAEQLGLNGKILEGTYGEQVFSGNLVPEGAQPLAQAYAGHQFGHFTMLGDGRANLLGEHVTPDGRRYDVHLKGSGKTPYSRRGDGKAALAPMLREYVISEAMHALGIPTTRSLAVVTTGEIVYREYELEGAVLTRLAASHLRVGTFEYARQWGGVEQVKVLADYAISRHDPDILPENDRYFQFFQRVCNRQAALIAKWQLVGFIHGVMNTDNMVLSGETIDYGPCAFMDVYHPETVFSSIDSHGRYAYRNQPTIGAWNLARLAETLLPLFAEQPEQAVEMAKQQLDEYHLRYRTHWMAGMQAKLGLISIVEEEQDSELIDRLFELMEKFRADYTNTFRAITLNRYEGEYMFETTEFHEWQQQRLSRLTRQNTSPETVEALLKRSNPSVIPRNHLVEEALAAAVEGDLTVMHSLLSVLHSPYSYEEVAEKYISPSKSTRPYRTFCGT